MKQALKCLVPGCIEWLMVDELPRRLGVDADWDITDRPRTYFHPNNPKGQFTIDPAEHDPSESGMALLSDWCYQLHRAESRPDKT